MCATTHNLTVWMDRAWKSNASAVHAAKPTTKNSQSFAESWAIKLTGFLRGIGLAHSQEDSPSGPVTTTRCFHVKRSRMDWLAVGITPLATGSAGS